MLRYLTAGESHGKALVAILEGMVSNLPLIEEDVNKDLQRRQLGIGRGSRMSLEKDEVEFISGVRKGKTIGSPIALLVKNADHFDRDVVMTRLRPGHADLPGMIKYNQDDLRNVLEMASARETAVIVAIGAVCKKLL